MANANGQATEQTPPDGETSSEQEAGTLAIPEQAGEIITPGISLTAATKEELGELVAARYNLGRSGYHGRRKALGIDPVEIDGEWCFSEEAIALFDLLDDWIKSGKSVKSFTIPQEYLNGEIMDRPRHNRKAQELAAATIIAAYRQAAEIEIDELPEDLREAVEEEREKFSGPTDPEPSAYRLESLVQKILDGKI